MFRCRVLPEIELLYLISYTKSFSIKTNSSILRTIARTCKHRACTVVLLSTCTLQQYPNASATECYGVYKQKKIRNPLSNYRDCDTAIHSAAPSVLKAATMAKGWRAAAWYWGFPIIKKELRKLLQGGNTEQRPTIYRFAQS